MNWHTMALTDDALWSKIKERVTSIAMIYQPPKNARKITCDASHNSYQRRQNTSIIPVVQKKLDRRSYRRHLPLMMQISSKNYEHRQILGIPNVDIRFMQIYIYKNKLSVCYVCYTLSVTPDYIFYIYKRKQTKM